MRVTYLDHSGFFIELDRVCLLFDWLRGDLPPVTDKPLLAFSGHRHPDHFQPTMFRLDAPGRDIAYILAENIRLTDRHIATWQLTEETLQKCRSVHGGEVFETHGVTVETLYSMDGTGAAYLVTAEGRTIFHAGELCWWYWEDESDEENAEMEQKFKTHAEPLRGRHIDLAMLHLDPMLRQYAAKNVQYFNALADIDRILPMNQWNEYDFTEEFLAEYPEFGGKLLPITGRGQTFVL